MPYKKRLQTSVLRDSSPPLNFLLYLNKIENEVSLGQNVSCRMFQFILTRFVFFFFFFLSKLLVLFFLLRSGCYLVVKTKTKLKHCHCHQSYLFVLVFYIYIVFCYNSNFGSTNTISDIRLALLQK